MPPPPGKGRIVIGPNAESNRRKLPAQPQRMPVVQPQRMPTGHALGHPQRPHITPTQRALPATAHIYGNITGGPPGMSYISSPDRGSSPASALLTNLANKRILNNVKR